MAYQPNGLSFRSKKVYSCLLWVSCWLPMARKGNKLQAKPRIMRGMGLHQLGAFVAVVEPSFFVRLVLDVCLRRALACSGFHLRSSCDGVRFKLLRVCRLGEKLTTLRGQGCCHRRGTDPTTSKVSHGGGKKDKGKRQGEDAAAGKALRPLKRK